MASQCVVCRSLVPLAEFVLDDGQLIRETPINKSSGRAECTEGATTYNTAHSRRVGSRIMIHGISEVEVELGKG